MRKRKPGRLQDIAAAALAVFTRQGFRLTQMADVAREAGISAGALYSYVDGKEALLELAIAQALGEVPEADQPFQASGIANIGRALVAKLPTVFSSPLLEQTSRQNQVTTAQLAAIVEEVFVRTADHRRLFWLLDRCARDVPELDGLYETAVRGRLFADFTTAISIAANGRFAADEAAAHGRALLEMIAWMAMHRHRDRQPPTVSDEVARKAVVDIVLRSVR